MSVVHQRSYGFAVLLFLFACFITAAGSATPAFAQGTKSFAWDAPTTNADGSTPVDLTGYELAYGTTNTSFPTVVPVGNALTGSIAFAANGTYYVVVRAYDAAGNRSVASNVVSVTISPSGSSDSDGDSVPNTSDCAPTDATKWRNQAYPDPDADGIRNSATLGTVACFGTTAPSGSTLSVNGPDNCPTTSNANQANADGDSQGDACDTDDDNDGSADTGDCAPTDATKWRSQAYPDGDGDGVRNSTTLSTVACFGATVPAGYTLATNGPDNCPTVPNPSQSNSDGDALGDACDTDSDSDGTADAVDCAPTDATKWRNQAYPDGDGDGIRNSTTLSTVTCFGSTAPAGSTLATNGPDNCPSNANANQANTDGDALGDVCDSDDDNDGTADSSDCAPTDATKWRNQVFADSDLDGIRNSTTPSTVACFGSAVPAGYTANANGPDNCPSNANANQANADGDSQGDVCDTNDDNDSVPDANDCAPLNATQWRNQAYVDSDIDGIRDAVNVVLTYCYGNTAPAGWTAATNGPDNCVGVANSDQLNTDGDSQGNACDSNDDNDSVADANDCAPIDATKWRNQAYLDSDNDGVRNALNVVLTFCYGTTAPAGWTTATNGPDNCPTVANPNQADADRDGVGDVCEQINSDSDGDGLNDAAERNLGTDPNKADTDGDGVNDGQEVTDQTNPLDRGSADPVLGKRACVEWNGFLGGMGNVFEHVNLSGKALAVKSDVLDLTGTVRDTLQFVVAAGAQFDALVHDLAGRARNSYGLVCSTHDGNDGDLDGRMVYYKANQAGARKEGQFQFAFGMSLSPGKRGSQFVPFNTYQPGLNPNDKQNPVANWIQLTNLGTVTASGELIYYDQQGAQLARDPVTLPAGGRGDFSGHRFGANLVGTIEWRPSDAAVPFLFRNVRYVYDNARGVENFDTAFQLEGLYGSGEELLVPIDTIGRTAVLELMNTLNEPVAVDVTVAGGNGASFRLTLPAYGSYHYIADAALGRDAAGFAIVKGAKANSIAAVAMEYAYRRDMGVANMYGLPAKPAIGSVLRGSYNTFLDQSSWLIVVSPTSQNVTVSAVNGNGEARASRVLQVDGVRAINLNEFANANEYGVVTVQPERGNSIVAWVTRVRGSEYVIPTPVR